MEIVTKSFETKNGSVEGVQVKWAGFGILLVAGRKGFLGCGVFDMEACEKFNIAAALVESTPASPIGTLERFADRKIIKANSKARILGISAGMDVRSAFEIIA